MEPTFVETIPRELEPGKLYVSIPYTTAVHLCPCGCDGEVVTTLHPARFSLTFDGEAVSLHPSVGNSGLPCRSHYFIRSNRVRWATSLSNDRVEIARTRDRRALDSWAAIEPPDEDQEPRSPATRNGWLAQLRRRFRLTR